MQRNCLILCGTRIAKILMYHSNGVFWIKLNYIFQVQGIECSATAKYQILFSGLNPLHKLNKLVSRCRQESKYYLSNFKIVPG